jgi:hypothetical protein
MVNLRHTKKPANADPSAETTEDLRSAVPGTIVLAAAPAAPIITLGIVSAMARDDHRLAARDGVEGNRFTGYRRGTRSPGQAHHGDESNR